MDRKSSIRKKRGKKPFRAFYTPRKVEPPAGVSIEARLYLKEQDLSVILSLGDLLTRLRNQDLVHAINGVPWNQRKVILTPDSSARWAGSITQDNNDQLRLSRDNLTRAINGWQKAIKTIEQRLSAPIPIKIKDKVTTVPTSVSAPAQTSARSPISAVDETLERPGRGKGKGRKKVVGYGSGAERAAKQVRLTHLKSKIAAARAELSSGDISICKGGKDFLNSRHHLEEAGLSLEQWQEQYAASRRFLTADGEAQKRWGNETIRVSPQGVVVIKLPPALTKTGLGNIGRGKDKTHYQLSTPVTFYYRHAEWLTQIQHNRAVSYTLKEDPIKHKWYLAAAWTQEPIKVQHSPDRPNILAVDTNADHFSARVIDPSGNPVGPALSVPLPLGLSSKRSRASDGIIRAGLSVLIHYALLPCWQVGLVVFENLGFEDSKGREQFGYNKPFRKTISGFPTAITANRASAMFTRAGLEFWFVDPAYTSKWGEKYWLKRLSSPTHKATTHEGAAVVIGRRFLGYRARTRSGVGTGKQSIPRANLPVAPSIGPKPRAVGKTTAPQLSAKGILDKTNPGPQNQPTPPGDNRCHPAAYFTPDNSDVRFVRY